MTSLAVMPTAAARPSPPPSQRISGSSTEFESDSDTEKPKYTDLHTIKNKDVEAELKRTGAKTYDVGTKSVVQLPVKTTIEFHGSVPEFQPPISLPAKNIKETVLGKPSKGDKRGRDRSGSLSRIQREVVIAYPPVLAKFLADKEFISTLKTDYNGTIEGDSESDYMARIHAPLDKIDAALAHFYQKVNAAVIFQDVDDEATYINASLDCFESRFHGIFIGSGGKVRRQIEHRFAVKLQIEEREKAVDTINLFGPYDRIRTATQHLFTMFTLRMKSDKSVIITKDLASFDFEALAKAELEAASNNQPRHIPEYHGPSERVLPKIRRKAIKNFTMEFAPNITTDNLFTHYTTSDAINTTSKDISLYELYAGKVTTDPSLLFSSKAWTLALLDALRANGVDPANGVQDNTNEFVKAYIHHMSHTPLFVFPTHFIEHGKLITRLNSHIKNPDITKFIDELLLRVAGFNLLQRRNLADTATDSTGIIRQLLINVPFTVDPTPTTTAVTNHQKVKIPVTPPPKPLPKMDCLPDTPLQPQNMFHCFRQDGVPIDHELASLLQVELAHRIRAIVTSATPQHVLYRTLDSIVVNTEVAGADVIVNNSNARSALRPLLEQITIRYGEADVRFETADYGAYTYDNYVARIPANVDAASFVDSELACQAEMQSDPQDPATREFRFVKVMGQGSTAMAVIGFKGAALDFVKKSKLSIYLGGRRLLEPYTPDAVPDGQDEQQRVDTSKKPTTILGQLKVDQQRRRDTAFKHKSYANMASGGRQQQQSGYKTPLKGVNAIPVGPSVKKLPVNPKITQQRQRQQQQQYQQQQQHRQQVQKTRKPGSSTKLTAKEIVQKQVDKSDARLQRKVQAEKDGLGSKELMRRQILDVAKAVGAQMAADDQEKERQQPEDNDLTGRLQALAGTEPGQGDQVEAARKGEEAMDTTGSEQTLDGAVPRGGRARVLHQHPSRCRGAHL